MPIVLLSLPFIVIEWWIRLGNNNTWPILSLCRQFNCLQWLSQWSKDVIICELIWLLATSYYFFSSRIRQGQQKQHGSSMAEARHLQHSIINVSGLVALAEGHSQQGSGVSAVEWQGYRMAAMAAVEQLHSFVPVSQYMNSFFFIVSVNSLNPFLLTSDKWIHLWQQWIHLLHEFI